MKNKMSVKIIHLPKPKSRNFMDKDSTRVLMKTSMVTTVSNDRDYAMPSTMRGLYGKPGVVWKLLGTYFVSLSLFFFFAFAW
jgi:hypothetical protein